MGDYGFQPGNSGFLLTYFAFLEYLEGSNNWHDWKHLQAVDREHSVFVSAYTYGLVQFKNRSAKFKEREEVKHAFHLFRRSSHNSRLIDVDATIMDMAAQAYIAAFEEEMFKGDRENISPFVEFATAAHWDLTLVVTTDSKDHFNMLKELIEYPVSEMKVER